MLRTSIASENTDSMDSIPKKYIGEKIEVLVYSIEEVVDEPSNATVTMDDFWGRLSDESALKLHENVLTIRNEWERNI